MRERHTCPACKEGRLRPIIYGLARGKLVEKAGRGEVVLAGCQVGEDRPAWDCPTCGREFREEELAGPQEAP